MRYCVTMQRTLRIVESFEAPNNEAAEEKAAEINRSTGLEEFKQGEVEEDYALCNAETRELILDWD